MPPALPAAYDKTRTPKQIEPVPDPSRRAAQRKDEGPYKVEHQQKRFHCGLSDAKPGDPPSAIPDGPDRLRYGANQPDRRASLRRLVVFRTYAPASRLRGELDGGEGNEGIRAVRRVRR